MRFSARIKDLIEGLMYVSAPSVCFICGEELTKHEKSICRQCLGKLPRTFYERMHDNLCEQKFWGKVNIHSAFGAYYYRKDEQMQRVIHNIKYYGKRNMGIVMGEEMGRIMLSQKIEKEYDILVPVPMHPEKQRQRGYNQTEIIAQGISNATGLPIRTDILVKAKNTVSQTKKSRYERYESIHDAFELNTPSEQLIGLRFLIIDDVLTTGNTIEACAKLLTSIPYTRVGVATLACASG